MKTIEMIGVKDWWHVGDHNFEFDYLDQNKEGLPPAGVVYCPIEGLKTFLQRCYDTGENAPNYILVSAYSDYGVCYQNSFPVYKDVENLVLDMCKRLPDTLDLSQAGYNGVKLNVPAPVDLKNCDLTHKYSLRTCNQTGWTFPTLPVNIKKWYVTNCSINESFVEPIPFGILNESKADLCKIDNKQEKEHWLYVNFTGTSPDRLELRAYFKHHYTRNSTLKDAFITFIEGRSQEEYFNDVAKSRFVLCPTGNGLDSYRVLESLYLGAIPVVEKARWNDYYVDAPILRVYSFDHLTLEMLEQAWQTHIHLQHTDNKAHNVFVRRETTFQYWKDKIDKDRELL